MILTLFATLTAVESNSPIQPFTTVWPHGTSFLGSRPVKLYPCMKTGEVSPPNMHRSDITYSGNNHEN